MRVGVGIAARRAVCCTSGMQGCGWRQRPGFPGTKTRRSGPPPTRTTSVGLPQTVSMRGASELTVVPSAAATTIPHRRRSVVALSRLTVVVCHTAKGAQFSGLRIWSGTCSELVGLITGETACAARVPRGAILPAASTAPERVRPNSEFGRAGCGRHARGSQPKCDASSRMSAPRPRR